MSPTAFVRRHDKPGQEFEVPVSDLRWGLRTNFSTLAWGQTSTEPQEGDVPYIRRAPDSQMCVRVDVLPTLAEGFKHFLTVPTADGLEAAP